MKAACNLLLLVALLGASSIVRADETLGRVRAIYFEAARYVLADPRVQRPPASAIFWADVELAAQSPERRRVLVQLPQDLKAAPGDLVGSS